MIRKRLVKKYLLIVAGLLLAAILVAALYRAVTGPDTSHMFVGAEAADLEIGPVQGSRFPGLQAVHGERAVTLLEEFAGPNGTVLVAFRSLDWCPYCQRQMLQLEEYAPFFKAAGIGLVAISYDAPALQRAFVDRHGVSVPVLSDRDALSFRTLGILNGAYGPGDPEYGIPHPGMIVVDREGNVAGKLFIEDYTRRVDSAAALAFARRALGLRAPLGGA